MLSLFQDIDLKSLLYEAYHKGARELLYVVPFSAKVLESCAKSKVSTHALTNLNCRGQFREIPWNQTSDVHRGSTLIMRVIM